MEKKLEGYIAKDDDGRVYFGYPDKPIKIVDTWGNFGEDFIKLPKGMFPDLTSDKAIEATIIIETK